MLHTKSGIPRPITKRKIDAGGGSKTWNERNDRVRAIKTDTIKDKDSHIEANSGHIAGCSESYNGKVACKTTRATKTGRHLVTSIKESLPTNLEVVDGSDSESSTKPVTRRTLINAPPPSRAKNVAVIGASDVKVTDCRLKSLAGGLQTASNPKSRHSLKTVAMPTASGLLQPNQFSYDHGRQNGYVLCIVLL